jgi:hypothetical protein
VLAAAHAETGDFRAALEDVEKARGVAFPEDRRGLEERATLYRGGKRLRL